MPHKIFDYFKTSAIQNMFVVSRDTVINWRIGRTPIPPEVEAEMDRLVKSIEE